MLVKFLKCTHQIAKIATSMAEKVPRVINSKEVGATKWIRLNELEYLDIKKGKKNLASGLSLNLIEVLSGSAWFR